MRVLLVNERPDRRTVIAEGLRKAGHTVGEAYDYRTGRRMLCSANWDLLIANIMLPGGLGGITLADMALRTGIQVVVCARDGDAARAASD